MTTDLISNWILASRKKSGLNQEQLGEKLGVTKANISAWENKKHSPNIQQLLKMVGVFKEAAPDKLINELSLSDNKEVVTRSDLSRNEQSLLLAFRNADQQGKNALLWIIEQCLKQNQVKTSDRLMSMPAIGETSDFVKTPEKAK